MIKSILLKIIYIIIGSILLLGCETTNFDSKGQRIVYPWNGMSLDEVKKTYLNDKKPDDIEGIYLSSDNRYEIAVIKNDTSYHQNYDYLGFLTDTNALLWRKGEVKFFLKSTATPTLFTGNYYMGDKQKVGRTFIFHAGYFEINLPTGPYGMNQKALFIKKYPSTLVSSNKNSKRKKNSQQSSGSAFFVNSNGYLITNYHVISKCNDNSKIMFNNKEYKATVIAKDKYLDLALLKSDISNNEYLTISGKPPEKLNRIVAAGYPFGKFLSDDLKFTSGIISSLKGLDDDTTRLQIDAALNPGSSGGPIVYENSGELVGVAVAGLRKDLTESVNFAIKSANVKMFLESNSIKVGSNYKKSSDVSKLLEQSTVYTFCK